MITLQNIKDSFIPIRLEILSPVHIGSGAMLSPLEYRIEQEPDGYYVYTIDYEAWLDSLSIAEAKDFTHRFAISDLKEIWKIFRDKIDKEAFAIAKNKCSKKAYGLSVKIKDIVSATRNPLNAAMLIPGSSIKGAIRTAIIDHHDKNENLKNAMLRNEYKKQLDSMFETTSEIASKEITENAFQALKVSDFELLPNESEFVKARMSELDAVKDEKDNGIKTICEVVPASKAYKFGKLCMSRFIENHNASRSPHIAKFPLNDWSFENLREVCNKFYSDRFNEDYEKFYLKHHFVQTKHFVDNLFGKIDVENAILLRIGHYSHIECMTVSDYAPKIKLFGNTRTLADDIYPFGWVLLHKCSMEEYEKGMLGHDEAKKIHTKRLENDRIKYLESLAKQQAILEATRLKKEAEVDAILLKRKEKEENCKNQQAEDERLEQEKLQRRQDAQAQKETEEQRIASLSPDAKVIALTLAKKANREEVLKAYELLDTLLESEQKSLAEAIKYFWEKENIWSGKKIKKPQQEKVAKIKIILKK